MTHFGGSLLLGASFKEARGGRGGWIWAPTSLLCPSSTAELGSLMWADGGPSASNQSPGRCPADLPTEHHIHPHLGSKKPGRGWKGMQACTRPPPPTAAAEALGGGGLTAALSLSCAHFLHKSELLSASRQTAQLPPPIIQELALPLLPHWCHLLRQSLGNVNPGIPAKSLRGHQFWWDAGGQGRGCFPLGWRGLGWVWRGAPALAMRTREGSFWHRSLSAQPPPGSCKTLS